MVGMSHKAIDILMHVVANVWIGNCASVTHYATHVITLDEFKVASGRGMICMDGEAIRDAERVSVFQNRNAAGDRTEKKSDKDGGIYVSQSLWYFCHSISERALLQHNTASRAGQAG
jgi:hypothetical protein